MFFRRVIDIDMFRLILKTDPCLFYSCHNRVWQSTVEYKIKWCQKRQKKGIWQNLPKKSAHIGESMLVCTNVFCSIVEYLYSWHFFHISLEHITRQWTKREKEDLDTLSKWAKSVKSLMQTIITKLGLHQSLQTRMLLNTCLSFMTNMLLSPPTRPIPILFLCVNHITQTA